MSDGGFRVPFLDLAALHADLEPDLDLVWKQAVAQTAFVAGGQAEKFEREWAEFCEVDHAVGVANGTDAIELVLLALGIGPEDEVIVPANTFIATAEAVVAVGATPIFVDVDPDTLLVTADTVQPAITPRCSAIIAVHLYGQPCRMDGIMALADSHGLAVIEDAAQAHGARWDGRRVGGLGTAATFSFYPGKNLGAFGDAGAVVTEDPELAARVRSLSNHGRADGAHVIHPLIGRNSRLDGIQAGVLSTKLPYLDRWNEARREARDRYLHRLGQTVAEPVLAHDRAISVWHLNVVRVPDRNRVAEEMRARGIDVRVHYPQLCHLHPGFENQPTLPVAEFSSPRLLSLPMFPTITDAEIALVCDTLGAVLDELGQRR